MLRVTFWLNSDNIVKKVYIVRIEIFISIGYLYFVKNSYIISRTLAV